MMHNPFPASFGNNAMLYANALGTPFNQASSVITIMRNVTAFYDREIARVQAIVDAQAGN